MAAISRLLGQMRDSGSEDAGLDASLRFLDESGELIGQQPCCNASAPP